jgi:hypothetical protein
MAVSTTSTSWSRADRTLLHNFAGSYRTDKKGVLDSEMNSLEGLLQNAKPPDDPLSVISPELSAEIRAILYQDDGLHPLLWEQAFRDGKVTMAPEEHKELLDELRKGGGKKFVNA